MTVIAHPAQANGSTRSLAGAVRPAERLGALSELQRRLHTARTVGELFAQASVEACRACGFARGVVLAIDDGHLTTTGMPAIPDAECDALRRRALAYPIALTPGSDEGELVRRVERFRRFRPSGVTLLKDLLGLEDYALAPIVPESRPVALLVVDRSGEPVDEDDREALALFAHLLGLALERVVLRTRLTELSAELRHLTASVHALVHEAMEAPIGVTSDYGQGPVFPSASLYAPSASQLSELLTDREREVARLMVNGLSNRDIGEELHLSTDTVKAYVARVLRKLGAANRVEAVARYLAMAQAGGGGGVPGAG
jgi:LuxR family transcriptional regulator, regulator of acetate metabolism